MDDKQHIFLFGDRVLPLHAMLMSSGRQRVEGSGYDWHGLQRGNHNFVIWQYTLAGRGQLDYSGERLFVEPGEAMLVHIPHNHRYRVADKPGFWEFDYLCLNGSEVLRLCHQLETSCGPIAKFAGNGITRHEQNCIFQLAEDGKIDNPYIASALAYRFLMALAGELIPSGHGTGQRPPWLRRVIEYCRNKLCGELNVSNMAKVAGYSQYHFSRLFHEQMKITPAAFVRDLRLRHAMRLLQTEKLGIKGIADECGFSSSSYFCRAFEHAYGQSPGAFRKSARI